MKSKLTVDNMIDDPGIYIVHHKPGCRSSTRVCKLSDLNGLSLPRRSALERCKDEACKALLDCKYPISISEQVDKIFDVIAKVDEETSDKENGLFIMGSDW